MITAASNRLINIAAVAFAGAAILSGAGNGLAHASTLVAQVSISKQRMQVPVDGRPAFRWKVSTGHRGYATPTGSYKPVRLEEMWHSRKYDNAPMPHSVFFHGGYAVHATSHLRRLGTAAADFYRLVKTFGAANTRIVISD